MEATVADLDKTLADWDKIFEDMDSDRTVVIIPQIDPNVSKDYKISVVRKFETMNPADVFEKYGVIKAARYGEVNFNAYLVILFKDAADATNLTKIGALTVHETDVMALPFRSHDKLIETIQQMNCAYRTYAPQYASPAPANSAENILNVLNDDCLHEIFQRIVRLPDIISIVNVCSRFRQVAEKAFISLFKRRKISFRELNPFGNVTLADIEKFLRRFGPSIFSITHSPKTDTIKTLKLLNKHCPNLNSLEMKLWGDIDIDEQNIIEIRPLLSKLSSLTVEHMLLSVCNHFISACTELEKLHVVVFVVDSALPDIKFSKLKDFKLCNRSEIPLNRFLAQHQQIEKLDVTCSPGIGRIISEEIPNVRELHINCFHIPINMLDSHELTKLTRTNISVRGVCLLRFPLGESVANLLKLKNVTRLRLQSALNSTNFDILIKLTKDFWHLEDLHISFMRLNFPEQIMSMDRIKEMLQHAKKLTKLNIHWPTNHLFHFQEKDYSDILLIVKNRSGSLKLNIESTTLVKDTVCVSRNFKTAFMNIEYLNTDARLAITNKRI